MYTLFERPDRLLVAVVLNCGGSAVRFEIAEGGHFMLSTIPAHAIQTYLFNRTRGRELIV